MPAAKVIKALEKSKPLRDRRYLTAFFGRADIAKASGGDQPRAFNVFHDHDEVESMHAVSWLELETLHSNRVQTSKRSD